jgi:hypothetical protein
MDRALSLKLRSSDHTMDANQWFDVLAVAAMTIAFVAFGVLLWKPLPVVISRMLMSF